MLDKKHRLKKMKDWDILFTDGRFVSGQYITLKFWKIDVSIYPRRAYDIDDLRVGFAVGKKVHKSAVKRNRVKRQMREIVRLLLKDDRIKQGFFLGFIAKVSILEKDYVDIERDVLALLRKAGLLI